MLQTAVVKLEISGKGLRDRDTITKSDPTCVVFLEQPRHITPTYSNVSPSTSGQFRPQEGYAVEPGHAMTNEPSHIRWREIARTECIKNNLNPHFKVQVTVPYHFGELQYIRLGLWDIDSKKSDLSTHDFLGDVRTTLGELVTARVWKAPLSSSNVRDTTTLLGGRRDLGTITVIVHENRDGSMMLIKGSLSAQRLDKKDLWSSDPYFIITQVGGSFETSRSQLYKSEVIRRNCNPVWRPFQIKATLPKGANKQDVILEFLVYDKDRFKRDNEIGLVKCSVAQLEQVSSLPVISEKKKRKRGRIYKNSGSLEFNRFRAFRMPSLVDYLQGGLKLHFSVAVDLTASNGNPQDRRSLHYRDAIYPNCYIRALSAIANVLRVYTPSDNMFTAFGFGAELPSRPGFASSCFPLGLGPEPHCHGIEGILQAYNVALNSVKLSGPTDFAPIIDKVSTICAQRTISQSDQHVRFSFFSVSGCTCSCVCVGGRGMSKVFFSSFFLTASVFCSCSMMCC